VALSLHTTQSGPVDKSWLGSADPPFFSTSTSVSDFDEFRFSFLENWHASSSSRLFDRFMLAFEGSEATLLSKNTSELSLQDDVDR
jgi:hypothetical protein